MTTLEIQGRHDACIALRMPPVLKAATAIALAELRSNGLQKNPRTTFAQGTNEN